MNTDVPVEDHAVIFFHADIQGVVIDGDGANSGVALVAPGSHTVSAFYYKDNFGSITKSDYISFDHRFIAGHSYYVYPDLTSPSFFRSGTVSFSIADETDPANQTTKEAKGRAARSETVRAAQYPAKPTLGVTYWNMMQKAENAGPTQFEGTWVDQNDNPITFTGKTYQFVRRFSEYIPPTFTTAGTFEFTDTTITLTELKTTDRGLGAGVFYAYLNNVKKPKTTEYTYSFTGDNRLVLSQGKKQIGIYVKQN
jgi:hypothetical protein